MDTKLQGIAAAVGRDQDVAEKLDQLLTGPNDRAFVICEYGDCKLNMKGRCTIFAVQDVPRMKPNKACDSYQARR